MSAPTPSTLDPHHRTATWSPVAEILSVCAVAPCQNVLEAALLG
jgi:hypothetical protein